MAEHDPILELPHHKIPAILGELHESIFSDEEGAILEIVKLRGMLAEMREKARRDGTLAAAVGSLIASFHKDSENYCSELTKAKPELAEFEKRMVALGKEGRALCLVAQKKIDKSLEKAERFISDALIAPDAKLKLQREKLRLGDVLKSPIPTTTMNSDGIERVFPLSMPYIGEGSEKFQQFLMESEVVPVVAQASGTGKTRLAYSLGATQPVLVIRLARYGHSMLTPPWEELLDDLKPRRDEHGVVDDQVATTRMLDLVAAHVEWTSLVAEKFVDHSDVDGSKERVLQAILLSQRNGTGEEGTSGCFSHQVPSPTRQDALARLSSAIDKLRSCLPSDLHHSIVLSFDEGQALLRRHGLRFPPRKVGKREKERFLYHILQRVFLLLHKLHVKCTTCGTWLELLEVACEETSASRAPLERFVAPTILSPRDMRENLEFFFDIKDDDVWTKVERRLSVLQGRPRFYFDKFWFLLWGKLVHNKEEGVDLVKFILQSISMAADSAVSFEAARLREDWVRSPDVIAYTGEERRVVFSRIFRDVLICDGVVDFRRFAGAVIEDLVRDGITIPCLDDDCSEEDAKLDVEGGGELAGSGEEDGSVVELEGRGEGRRKDGNFAEQREFDFNREPLMMGAILSLGAETTWFKEMRHDYILSLHRAGATRACVLDDGRVEGLEYELLVTYCFIRSSRRAVRNQVGRRPIPLSSFLPSTDSIFTTGMRTSTPLYFGKKSSHTPGLSDFASLLLDPSDPSKGVRLGVVLHSIRDKCGADLIFFLRVNGLVYLFLVQVKLGSAGLLESLPTIDLDVQHQDHKADVIRGKRKAVANPLSDNLRALRSALPHCFARVVRVIVSATGFSDSAVEQVRSQNEHNSEDPILLVELSPTTLAKFVRVSERATQVQGLGAGNEDLLHTIATLQASRPLPPSTPSHPAAAASSALDTSTPPEKGEEGSTV